MKRVTLCTFGILVIFVLAMSPGSECSRRRILIAKKLAALMLLNKKRYIFVAPFPLPVPLPVITKVKHIVHKEKVPVPVPVPHHVTRYVAVPVPVPEKSWSDDSWKTPDVSASELSYKIAEKPHRHALHPKNLDKIYAESTHSMKYEKPIYSESPIKISDKSYLDGSYKLPMDKTYNLDEFDEHMPKRLYTEDLKFDLKDYAAAGSSLNEETIELPRNLKNHHQHQLAGEESFKFPENAYSDDILSKLSGDLATAASGNPELFADATELSGSAENHPALQTGDLIKKKK